MAHDIKIGIDETLDPADWESMRTLAHVTVLSGNRCQMR
jgi:hypothetical protein